MIDKSVGLFGGSALLVESWETPSTIRLDGSHLAWGPADRTAQSTDDPDGFWRGEPTRWVSAEPEMFDSFMRLGAGGPRDDAAGPADQFLGFAERWGVLGLCDHGLPASHRSEHRLGQTRIALGDGRWLNEVRHEALLSGDLRVLLLLDDSEKHLPGPQCRPEPREPLWIWRLFASQARAIAVAASVLRRGEPCDDEIVAVRSLAPASMPLVQAVPAPTGAGGQRVRMPGTHDFVFLAPTTRRENIAQQRFFLARVVQEWLELADLSLQVAWPPEGHARIGYHATGLFGAVAVELALAIVGSKGVWLCSHCGNPYSDRKRAPKAGARHYCSACKTAGPQAAWREGLASSDS